MFLDRFLTNELAIYQRQLGEQFSATTYFFYQMRAKEIIHSILSKAKINNLQNYSVIKQEADKIREY